MGVFDSHLCGSYHQKETQCEHFLYADESGMTIGKKKLQQYYAYCTAEGKCRSLGCVATFTGNSPTWCIKRQALQKSSEA